MSNDPRLNARLVLTEARFEDGGHLTITARWGTADIDLRLHCKDCNAMRDLWRRVEEQCLQAVMDEVGWTAP